MTITVTKTHSIGSKTFTTTASAEVPNCISPIGNNDEDERQSIIRVTEALLAGIQPRLYVQDSTGADTAEVYFTSQGNIGKKVKVSTP